MEFWNGTQTASTLTKNNAGGDQRMPDKDNFNCVIGGDSQTEELAVRRLTPLECERLQGYPDDWLELPLKETMTEDEFDFWQEVRRNMASFQDKPYKPCKNVESMCKWYNSMVTADSSKYKALGNSIATGQNSYWKFILKRISAQYDYEPKIGSLFDGIGGFPMVWEQINGKGSARWASEIEPYCIAVTKYNFSEEECE